VLSAVSPEELPQTKKGAALSTLEIPCEKKAVGYLIETKKKVDLQEYELRQQDERYDIKSEGLILYCPRAL
jgi:hypothetical protein